MNEIYCILVKGHIAERWSEWLEDFTIWPKEDGTTEIVGAVPYLARIPLMAPPLG